MSRRPSDANVGNVRLFRRVGNRWIERFAWRRGDSADPRRGAERRRPTPQRLQRRPCQPFARRPNLSVPPPTCPDAPRPMRPELI